MAKKAEKRKVRKLKDMIDRKVDKGQGNPKTTNRVKTKPTVVKPKTEKSSKNPIGDFLEKTEKDSRKLPVRVEQPKKIRGNPNLAKSPGVITQGYTPGSASRAVVPYSSVSKTATSAIKDGLKLGGKILGAAAFIVDPSFMSSKTGGQAGPDSDKPTGPLMRGNSTVVNKAGGGPEKRQGSSSASMRLRSKIAGRPEYPGSNVRKGGGGGGAGDSGRVGGGLSGSGVSRSSTVSPATATAGTGTSTGAAEKMTNFERLKARQYEREGYGGRVMTRKKATEQVMKERQYKSPLAGLFKRKGK